MGKGNINIVHASDIIIAPIVIFTTLCFVILFAMYFYKNDMFLKKTFIWGFILKIIGAIAYTLVYQFYFGWGDTFMYYQTSKDIALQLFENPPVFFEILFLPIENYSQLTLDFLKNNIGGWIILKKSSATSVVKYSVIANVFGFGSYIGASILISAFSFLGIWSAFIIFYKRYPNVKKQLALSWIYLPSMIFWSSTLTKEPLSIAGLGFSTWAIYNVFIKQKNILISLIVLYFSFQLVYGIKSYIIISLAIFSAIWVIMSKRENIKNVTLKKLSLPLYFIIGLFAMVGFISFAGSLLEEYAIASVLEEMESTASWISGVTERTNGSGYNLGNISYTPQGMITAFPKAVIVTFYRPYLWEARKVMVLVSAIESFFTLFITIYVIFKVGILKSISRTITNADILFCFGFSLLFGFFVGMSSFNFGALARYKIPCLPYYFTALSILYSTYLNSKTFS